MRSIIFFASGSTGRPRGMEREHSRRALCEVIPGRVLARLCGTTGERRASPRAVDDLRAGQGSQRRDLAAALTPNMPNQNHIRGGAPVQR